MLLHQNAIRILCLHIKRLKEYLELKSSFPLAEGTRILVRSCRDDLFRYILESFEVLLELF